MTGMNKTKTENWWQAHRACHLLCAAGFALAGGASAASSIRAEPYGVTSADVAVERVTLTNDCGMQLSYIDYGATLVAATVADRYGRRANIVLGVTDLEHYMRSNRRYGAVMGRYAGRIGRTSVHGIALQRRASTLAIWFNLRTSNQAAAT